MSSGNSPKGEPINVSLAINNQSSHTRCFCLKSNFSRISIRAPIRSNLVTIPISCCAGPACRTRCTREKIGSRATPGSRVKTILLCRSEIAAISFQFRCRQNKTSYPSIRKSRPKRNKSSCTRKRIRRNVSLRMRNSDFTLNDSKTG